MNILLINANPVVSRLLILCTRDDVVLLHEAATIDEVQGSDYDVVFVDEASYGRDVAELLGRFKSAKKVFISYRSDAMRGFDVTIKKPFLPSQIIELIASVDVNKDEDIFEIEEEALVMHEEEVRDKMPSIFPLAAEENEEEALALDVSGEEESTPAVLDVDEIEKIKSLLNTDDDIDIPEIALSDEEIEARKVEVIKEKLIADGLEIVDEDKIVEELSIGLDGTLGSVEKDNKKTKNKKQKNKKSKTKKFKKKNKSNKLKFTDETMEYIEDAVEMAMASMTKKQMKKLLKGKEIEVKIKLEDNDA